MLELDGVNSGYGETQVLHGLTLRAERGRVTFAHPGVPCRGAVRGR